MTLRSTDQRIAAFSLVMSLLMGVALLMPAPAAAQDQLSAAVLNLEGKGVDAELVSTLTSIVRNEAQQVERYKVVNKFELNFSDILLMIGCDAAEPGCLQQVAEKVDARLLIFGEVVRQKGTYRFSLSIFDGETGRMVNRLVRTLGETDDPAVAFRKEIESFFQRERTVPMTRMEISSDVADARILIDGVFVGTVPLERTGLPAGEYVVEVGAEGYPPWKTTLKLEEGADIRLFAPLQETGKGAALAAANADPSAERGVGIDTTAPPTRSSSSNWGAWSALGAGGLALAGSGVFALLMSDVESDLEAERGAGTLTRSRFEELVDQGQSHELTHRILLGVGLVGVTAGVVWLALSGDDEAETVELGVEPTGVRARLRW